MTRAAYFERLKDGFRADSCKKCGKCMKACPQHIQIPDMLETAHPVSYTHLFYGRICAMLKLSKVQKGMTAHENVQIGPSGY